MSIHSTSPSTLQTGSVGKDCLILLGLLYLGLIGGCIYYQSRRPHFSGTSPLAIDVRVADFSSTNIYQMSITNRAACEAIVREFSRARPVFSPAKQIGTLTFRFEDGKTNVALISPGKGAERYTFIFGGVFHLARERFKQLLQEGGADVSKFP